MLDFPTDLDNLDIEHYCFRTDGFLFLAAKNKLELYLLSVLNTVPRHELICHLYELKMRYDVDDLEENILNALQELSSRELITLEDWGDGVYRIRLEMGADF